MARIGELDLPGRLAPYAPVWVTQIGFALACTAGAFFVRIVVDLFAPGAGPYSIGYAAVLIATLFAGWRSGLFATAIIVPYVWYFLLPYTDSFRFEDPGNAARTAVNGCALLMVVAISDRFRTAAMRATEERDREIAERDLFLTEFDHRVKNNFAVVASLLDMQRRRSNDPATVEALGIALSRVDSIARAHRHLYRGDSAPGTVDMRTYLNELCDALSEALLLHGAIQLRCGADAALMPRDRAVSIGLVVNELVTNAAKHAFADRTSGLIEVRFANEPGGWRIQVRDNGIGMPEKPPAPKPDSGLGQKLIDAFARQAGGTMETESGPGGTCVTLHIEA